MKRKILLLLFLYAFLGLRCVYASHAVGTDLTYTCLGGNQYLVRVAFYRDCNGVSAPTSVSVNVSSSSCGQSTFVNCFRVNGTGQQVVPVCPTVVTTCSGGSFPGIQEWVYEGTVTLPQQCTDWVFSYQLCCRNNAISTISSPGSENIYVESKLDNLTAPCNSSPSFYNKPVPFACVGQLFCFNHGATDADGDSLVYSLVNPMTGPGTGVNYLGSYSATQPVASNPAVVFSNTSGDICMTPTTQQVTVMAVQVKEYRNGVLIGSVLRDIQLNTVACSNNLPSVDGINGSGQFTTAVCAGSSICFNTTSLDADASQNVSITTNVSSAIPGATFTTSAGNRPVGTFCWNPTAANVSNNYHCFTLTVKDNACSINGQQIYSFCIKVTSISVNAGPDKSIPCNTTTNITAQVNGGIAPYTYQWSNGATTQSVNVPAGTYTVTATDSVGCIGTDIVVISNDNPPTANFSAGNVCLGSAVSFTDNSTIQVGSISSWKWNFGDPASVTDTSVLQHPAYTYTSVGVYTATLVVVGNNGCIASTKRNVSVNPIPTASFTASTACLGTATLFNEASSVTSGSITGWSWDFGEPSSGTANTSTSQFPAHTYAQPGTYTVTLTAFSSNSCSSTYSLPVSVYPLAVADFSTASVCVGNVNTFTDLSSSSMGTINSWQWNFGDAASGVNNSSTLQHPTHFFTAAGSYSVNLTVYTSYGCQTDTMKVVTVHAIPTATFISSTVCVGNSTVFTDQSSVSSGSISNWSWNFGEPSSGGANTSLLQHPSHVYGASGNYTASLTVTSSQGCQQSVNATVTVMPLPTAFFTANTICFGNFTTFNDASSGSPVTWSWSFGDPASGANNSSLQQHPTHVFSSSGTFTVSLSVSNAGGCVSTYNRTVVVNAIPNPDFTTQNVCLNQAANFVDGSSTSSGTISSWSWNFNDPASGGANTSLLKHPSHLFTSPGNYTVILSVANSFGCINSVARQITIHPIPVINFSPTTACLGTNTQFTDLTTVSSGGLSSWSWSFGDPTSGVFNSSIVQHPQHNYTSSGIFTVSFTVTSSNGCQVSTSKPVSVTPTPVANYNAPAVCQGAPSIFTDLSTISNGSIASWHWDFSEPSSGVNNTSSLQHPSHTYATPGQYDVVLTVTSDFGCQSVSVQHVLVRALPLTGFSSQNICLNKATSFTDNTITNDSIVSWNWNFGEPVSGSLNVSSLKNPTHIYGASGSYTVALVARDSKGCQQSAVSTVLVFPLPQATFTNTSVCFQVPTAFTDLATVSSGSVNSWLWNFGEPSSPNNTSGSKNPTHTFLTPGTFAVNYTVTTNNGCVDDFSANVRVHPKPQIKFGAANVCLNNLSQFRDSSTIQSGSNVAWLWKFNDILIPDSSILQHPSHLFSSYGSYLVKLKVISDKGCTDSMIRSHIVYPNPVANFSVAPVCLGKSSVFKDLTTVPTGSVNSWKWKFDEPSSGSADSSAVQHPTHTYALADTFLVTLDVVSTGGCKNAVTKKAIVYPLPVPSFIVPGVCRKDTSFFKDNSTIPSGVINRWLWEYGDGSMKDTLQHPKHLFAVSDTFKVTHTAISSYGCRDSITKDVVIYPLPLPDFDFTTECLGNVTQFTDKTTIPYGAINTRIWYFGDGNTNVNIPNPSHKYAKDSVYTVYLVARSNFNCRDTAFKQVNVNPVPDIGFVVDDPNACLKKCSHFIDSTIINSGSIISWHWDFGDNTSDSVQHPTKCYKALGNYDVTLTATSDQGCSNTSKHNAAVTVFSSPIADFDADSASVSVLAPTVQFIDKSTLDVVRWRWDFGDNKVIDSTIEYPIHVYPELAPVQYTARLIVENKNTCTDTAWKIITVYPDASLYVPNAFSPNGDGLNDEFSAEGVGIKQFQLWIYDRWGNQLWFTDDFAKKWNGKVLGKTEIAPEDVYYWLIEYTDILDNSRKLRGHVTLVK